MVGRKLLALSLLAAVLASPPVARARLICRWTGVEVAAKDCQDGQRNDGVAFLAERCCETRVQASLPAAKAEIAGNDLVVASAVEIQLAWFEAFQASPSRRIEPLPPPRVPLSETRILLI
jgi:hypothetical protein